jgi:hypothetical protein
MSGSGRAESDPSLIIKLVTHKFIRYSVEIRRVYVNETKRDCPLDSVDH